jgi:predicted DNA-binding ribbon-helix-helix protein
MMKSSVIKRSIVIEGHKTSISIEESFWVSLKELARARQMTLSNIVASSKADRAQGSNLSSAIRVYILSQLRAMVHASTVIGEGPSLAPHERSAGQPDVAGHARGGLR